jgi:hypothetical protein
LIRCLIRAGPRDDNVVVAIDVKQLTDPAVSECATLPQRWLASVQLLKVTDQLLFQSSKGSAIGAIP